MIGRLRGLLAEVAEEEALIDVMGVGYLVRCGARTLSRLPPVGDETVLHIDSQTREDGTRLYGFLTREERSVFVLLQAIQGVGPKAALSVLDVLPPADLAAAVAREDKAAVARAQGVGPKLALRIVVELKGKPLGAGLTVGASSGASAVPVLAQPSAAGEATSALMGLGLSEPVARRAVEQALARLGPEPDLPVLIKAALQESAR
ncbi:MAG TPA: Holliday junction branch migration protein RuvA [Caulobacteraceae bacterium]|jgi:Holliday junction DNA helicase RuvA|nr:Holliday junction branch migration protein RuvA [Caulobacteraceae bacterium]